MNYFDTVVWQIRHFTPPNIYIKQKKGENETEHTEEGESEQEPIQRQMKTNEHTLRKVKI